MGSVAKKQLPPVHSAGVLGASQANTDDDALTHGHKTSLVRNQAALSLMFATMACAYGWMLVSVTGRLMFGYTPSFGGSGNTANPFQ